MKTFVRSSALLILLVSTASLWAETKTVQVTVAAGKVDRHNSPVSVPVVLTAPAGQADDYVAQHKVELTDAQGNKLPGQLTRPSLLSSATAENSYEIHFILPQLTAGQTATLTAAITEGADSAAGKGFAWKDVPGQFAELSCDGRPVLRYMYAAFDNSTPATQEETFKVYHHVFDPAGKRLLTKGPGGLYTHHRGLFFGFNKISYGDQACDIWHCRKGEHQSHAGFLSVEAGPVLGRHRLAIDWYGADGKIFAKEQREMTAYNTPGGTMIEFASRLESQVGPVKLDGDPQHAGFHFRATQDVPDKTQAQTYYVRPDGADKPGQYRNWPMNKDHVNLPWNAMSIVVDDQRYTVCYLDRPENPKESRFSERNYGRFGSYFEYQLDTGKPLELNYRIWLQLREMTVEGVDALDRDFVAPVQASVKAG